MTNNIKKFAILGERCTGTNCLEEAILKNFVIDYTAEFGNKHFFCYNNYNKRDSNDTLFIGIVRNPIYWLNSFSKELHHVSSVNKASLQNFLFNEFYSVETIKEETNFFGNKLLLNNKLNYNQKEIINTRDLNYLNGKKYKNIFELRKVKQNFLIKLMPFKVKNFILINYEDILYNFEITMNIIKNKFHLKQKLSNFEKVTKYKKSITYNFIKQRDITFSVDTIKLIWKNLDIQQENALGYFPFNNNYFFVEKYKFKNNTDIFYNKEENLDQTLDVNLEQIIEINRDQLLDENLEENLEQSLEENLEQSLEENLENYIYKKIENKNNKLLNSKIIINKLSKKTNLENFKYDISSKLNLVSESKEEQEEELEEEQKEELEELEEETKEELEEEQKEELEELEEEQKEEQKEELEEQEEELEEIEEEQKEELEELEEQEELEKLEEQEEEQKEELEEEQEEEQKEELEEKTKEELEEKTKENIFYAPIQTKINKENFFNEKKAIINYIQKIKKNK